jgi:hypothetical protein
VHAVGLHQVFQRRGIVAVFPHAGSIVESLK